MNEKREDEARSGDEGQKSGIGTTRYGLVLNYKGKPICWVGAAWLPILKAAIEAVEKEERRFFEVVAREPTEVDSPNGQEEVM